MQRQALPCSKRVSYDILLGKELTRMTIPEMFPASWPVAVQPVVSRAFRYDGQLIATSKEPGGSVTLPRYSRSCTRSAGWECPANRVGPGRAA